MNSNKIQTSANPPKSTPTTHAQHAMSRQFPMHYQVIMNALKEELLPEQKLPTDKKGLASFWNECVWPKKQEKRCTTNDEM